MRGPQLAALAVCLQAAACGGDIGDGGGGDAGAGAADADSVVDADPLPDVEVALGPFGAPALIGPLSDANATDDDPSLTDDMLELYFNSDRAGGIGGGDIWVSTRASVADPFGAPVLVAELSTTAGETTPEVLGNGLVIYLARPGGLGGTDVFMSTRADRQSAWGTPVRVDELSSGDNDRAPSPSVDHLEITIETDRPGGAGGPDLWGSTRPSTADAWSVPVPLTALNTAGSEGNGHWRGKDLFYNGDDPALAGGAEIKVARRPSVQAGFMAPELVAEVNSADADSDPWLSPDLRTIVFASNRSGDQELYMATR